jgi:hypothetical protein
MERTIKHDTGANLYAVVGCDGYIMECFDMHEQAAAYLSEYEANLPKTVGETLDMAKKHGALFRHD